MCVCVHVHLCDDARVFWGACTYVNVEGIRKAQNDTLQTLPTIFLAKKLYLLICMYMGVLFTYMSVHYIHA